MDLKIDITEKIFQEAIPVIEEIEKAGYEAYFVGGCVRDKILGRPIHDIDIASSARPDEIEGMFKKTFDVGKEHGTIIVLYDDTPYEITTFRTEGKYSDFRRPDQVDFVRSLEEDTLRRDFTVNALAIDSRGNLYDYHQGLADLENGIIRAVGNPHERFQEDALRMMRGVRFASQLGFEIESETLIAIKELAPLLDKIAIERIQIEMTKFLQGEYFYKNSSLLHETNLVKYLPGINNNSQAAFDLLGDNLKPLAQSKEEISPVLCWSLLLINLGYQDKRGQKNLLKKWKHSNKFQQDVVMTIELLNYFDKYGAWSRELVYYYPSELFEMVENYLKSHDRMPCEESGKIRDDLPIQNRNDLVVNGRDIMEILGLKRGNKMVGELLNEIEQKVLQGNLANDYTEIEAMILENK